ncbi:hypothetical protein [Insulibacter thermoxylanivorax]|nr:hypothetical protein [Insulibacter thermoxylanivorax]
MIRRSTAVLVPVEADESFMLRTKSGEGSPAAAGLASQAGWNRG